jgi:hypothetical protein
VCSLFLLPPPFRNSKMFHPSPTPTPGKSPATGRRGSTASDKKARSKSRARSKSPFRSFRWPKKTRPEAAAASHYSDDEEQVQRTLGKSLEAEAVEVRAGVWPSRRLHSRSTISLGKDPERGQRAILNFTPGPQG